MSSSSDSVIARRDLAPQYAAFVAEQLPFALAPACLALEVAIDASGPDFEAGNAEAIEALRPLVAQVLRRRLAPPLGAASELETTPGVTAAERVEQAVDHAALAIDGFLRREAIERSLRREERREVLRGMMVTRALDNQENTALETGFRSLGQEAIYAVCLRLRRGDDYARTSGWRGDVVAPSAHDLAAVLAMRPGAAMVREALRARSARAHGSADFRHHRVGKLAEGVLSMAGVGPTPLTVAGLAFAMADEGGGRVAVALADEDTTSLGTWHEAINTCAVRRLPAVFAVTNNQGARFAAEDRQTAARRFADKARGYGLLGVTLDGTDPDGIAAAFAWAAERARAGLGPTLIELVSMRMCGNGPAARDPIARYADRLELEGVVTRAEVDGWKDDALRLVAREWEAVAAEPWPDTSPATKPAEATPSFSADIDADTEPALPPLEPWSIDPEGDRFPDAIRRAVTDTLAAEPRAFELGPPLSATARVGIAIGASLEGMYPIVELPAELAADGAHPLIANAAAIRMLGSHEVPMVVRASHRGAGAVQETLAWLCRVPGLKIVVPSTPQDARALFAAAVGEHSPVIMVEHHADDLDARIRHRFAEATPATLPLGKAVLRRVGADLALVSYGANVHVAFQAAERLASDDGVEACVVDLRSLVPLDEKALVGVARHTGKILVVDADAHRGGMGESLAATVQAQAFSYLDAPVRVLGPPVCVDRAKPSAERAFRTAVDAVVEAGRALVGY